MRETCTAMEITEKTDRITTKKIMWNINTVQFITVFYNHFKWSLRQKETRDLVPVL